MLRGDRGRKLLQSVRETKADTRGRVTRVELNEVAQSRHNIVVYIVTDNLRDFAGAKRFGVHVITPRRFLEIIGQGK